MAYHETFWIAAATAAPVIALATQVGVSQSVGWLGSFFVALRAGSERVRLAAKRGQILAWAGYWVAVGNILLQAFMLLFALLSLIRRRDVVSPVPVGFLLFIGLLVVLLSAVLTPVISFQSETVAKLQSDHAEDDGQDAGS